MPAGDNERLFKGLIRERFGEILQGKQTWRNPPPNTVSISVDETIETTDYRLLIEIDSGNYAKLLVGQYMLINALNGDGINHRKDIFVVVHYNGVNGISPFNPERTRMNLRFCNQTFLSGDGIPFLVFNLRGFNDFISAIDSMELLNTRISALLEEEAEQ